MYNIHSFCCLIIYKTKWGGHPHELEGLRAGSGLKKTVFKASSTFGNFLAKNKYLLHFKELYFGHHSINAQIIDENERS